MSGPFGGWTATYGDDEFARCTERARAIADRLAEGSGESTVARMREAFRRATTFEWMFWDGPGVRRPGGTGRQGSGSAVSRKTGMTRSVRRW